MEGPAGMVALDLSWAEAPYGGFQHFSHQLVRYFKNHANCYFIVTEKSRVFFELQNSTNVIVVRNRLGSNSKYLNLLYYMFRRIVGMSVLQKKLACPFIYPAEPGHLFKSNTIVYVKHDVCRTTHAHLFRDSRFYSWYWDSFSKYYVSYSDVVATVTADAKKNIEHVIAKFKSVHVITNYVTAAEKLSEFSTSKKKRRILLFIGALVERKNVKKLLEIAALLSEQKLDFKVILIGRTGSYWKSLPEQERDLVTVLSDVTESEKEALLDKSILLHPSECEGFGIPILEAVKKSVPILCNDIPVFREILNDYAFFHKFSAPLANEPAPFLNQLQKAVSVNSSTLHEGRKLILQRHSMRVFDEQMELLMNTIVK